MRAQCYHTLVFVLFCCEMMTVFASPSILDGCFMVSVKLDR